MEKPLPSRESLERGEVVGVNLGFARMQFANNDQALRLNQMASTLSGISVEYNPEVWVSSFSRTEGGNGKIVIGGAALPAEIKRAFNWGVESKEDEVLLKAAHELSHAFQRLNGMEKSLTAFLAGSNDIDPTHVPYLELYEFLGANGKISGLSNLELYHQQSAAEKARITAGVSLDIDLLEDATELLAAYSIGDEYFNYRLDKSHLTEDKKAQLADLVVKVFHNHL